MTVGAFDPRANDRRNVLTGSTYFFTEALADRRSDPPTQEIVVLHAAVAETP